MLQVFDEAFALCKYAAIVIGSTLITLATLFYTW